MKVRGVDEGAAEVVALGQSGQLGKLGEGSWGRGAGEGKQRREEPRLSLVGTAVRCLPEGV